MTFVVQQHNVHQLTDETRHLHDLSIANFGLQSWAKNL